MKEHWFTNRQGFASIYFLSVFSGIALLTAVIATNESNRLQSAANLRRISEYQAAENAVLSEVKCGLKNDCLKDGSFQNGSAFFTLRQDGRNVTASIESPVAEILEIEIDPENGVVLDFLSLRNESDGK